MPELLPASRKRHARDINRKISHWLARRERFENRSRLRSAAAAKFRNNYGQRKPVDDLGGVFTQKACSRTAQSVLRQKTYRLEKRRAHLVIEILRREFLLRRFRQARAHLRRKIHDGRFRHAFDQSWSGRRHVSSPRNETLRTRKDSAAETSFENCGAACSRPCAANRPSSRNACRRKSPPSIRGQTETAHIPAAGQTAWTSIPIHSPEDRNRQTHSRQVDAMRPAWAPTTQNQNCPATHSAIHPPTDRNVLYRQKSHTLPDAIALP